MTVANSNKVVGGVKAGILRNLRKTLTGEALRKAELAVTGVAKYKRLTRDARLRIEEMADQGPVVVVSTAGTKKPWKVYTMDGWKAAVESGRKLAGRSAA